MLQNLIVENSPHILIDQRVQNISDDSRDQKLGIAKLFL